jgi:hypothetical protein
MTWLRLQWDRCGAWIAIGVGALALLLGWIGLSSTPYPAEQLPYIFSGGIAGIFFLGIGAMLWLSADLRDEWQKLNLIEDAIRDARASAASAPDESRDVARTKDSGRVRRGRQTVTPASRARSG